MTMSPRPNPPSCKAIDKAIQKGIRFIENGNYSDAVHEFLTVLKTQNDNQEANYYLGLLALEQNQFADSLSYLGAALEKQPDHGPFWIAYIDALDRSGQTDLARDTFKIAQQAGLENKDAAILANRLGLQALSHTTLEEDLQQSFADGKTADPEKNNRLLSLYKSNNFSECVALARSTIKQFPSHGFSWKILGASLNQLGQQEESITAMQQAIKFLPQDFEAFNNLGVAFKTNEALNKSETAFRQALAINDTFAEAHNNLGVTLLAQGRLQESEECFRKAIHIQPDYIDAISNLGICLKDQGNMKDAEVFLKQTLILNPSYAEGLNNLGNLLQAQSRLSEAEEILRKALILKPDFAKAHYNLGNVFLGQGNLLESERCYQNALTIDPAYSDAFDGLLFVSNYHADKSAEEIYELYQDYNKHFGIPHHKEWRTHTNNQNQNRRLKVGYVSPALYQHPVFNHLEPLFANHDKNKFELFVYSDVIKEDKATEHYKNQVEHWIPTVGMSHKNLAKRIRFDKIDILVDLAGHAGQNRLAVFARKPAPVSLHWLDFGYTTGLSAIDYYLTDIHTAPIGAENLFSEQLWRLPVPSFTYWPVGGTGNVSPLPALQRGYITFGTLTRAIRLNKRTIQAWVKILLKIDNSRLIIDSNNFKDPTAQESLKNVFSSHGIHPNRVDIGYHSPPWDTLRNIDIGLDCFPHNSGTTLFENLYMGIPFITYAHRPGVGRIGSSILSGIDRHEWIAHSTEDYIEKNVALATNISQLADIRIGLREEMQNSSLMDGKKFAKAIENAYQSMFSKWTTTITPASGKAPSVAPEAVSFFNSGVDHQVSNQTKEAQTAYIQALNIQPDLVDAYNNLGVVYQQQGSLDNAIDCFLCALKLRPQNVDAQYNLANTHKLKPDLHNAEENFRKVIDLQADHVEAHYNLGNILQEQGRLQDAEISLRNALAIRPDHIDAFSTLLYSLNYHPDKTSTEIYEAYKTFNNTFCLPLQESWKSHINKKDPKKRLNIGYVAPDFNNHPARYFLLPLLSNHDRKLFQIFAYINAQIEDSSTDLFYPYVDHWMSVKQMDDAEMAETIRNHNIDILIDLSGHTSGNRLQVFARRPAPVSLHWLDFGYTTGLTAIDYYLTDTITVPPGNQAFFSENLFNIQTPAFAYRPPENTGKVNALPAILNKNITFGTLTRATRINHRTIKVWAEILTNCPKSKLIINSGSYIKEGMQRSLLNQFNKYGIDESQLDIGFDTPPWDVLRRIDIMLDCFPHNSGTTLIESLYMGVPFITLADRPSVGRLGSSILTGIKHPEWIANSEHDYIKIALNLATNVNALKVIRATLRHEMENSPLMDESGFTRKFETACQKMFTDWCNKRGEKIDTSKNGLKKAHRTKPPVKERKKLTTLYDKGDHNNAIKLAQSLTKQFPSHGFAWKILGPLLFQHNQQDEGIKAMKQATKLLPKDADTHFNLGVALEQSGHHANARACYKKVLELDENYLQAQYNLANILNHNGQLKEAESYYRAVLSQKNDFFEAHCNLGNVLKAQGKITKSIVSYNSALKINPQSADVLSNLSLALKEQGNLIEAQKVCEQALIINSQSPEAHNNLGLILQAQNILPEAETSFLTALEINPDFVAAYNNLGLHFQKQHKFNEAETYYNNALTIMPEFVEALRNLGVLFQQQGKLTAAETCYQNALRIKSDDVKTLNNIAVILYKQGRISEAETICRKAVLIDPRYPKTYNNLSNILVRQGKIAEAEDMSAMSLKLNPDNTIAFNNLLFVSNYNPDKSGTDIFKKYQEFNRTFCIPQHVHWKPHLNDYQRKRPLKIGYVGSQFRKHSARHFLEPLLANHDRKKFKLFIYAELVMEDEQTEKYKSLADHWLTTSGLNDDELATQIRKDKIDILVDLSGHTDGNRLLVFARKPAPVSLHWLDFGYTTGLTAIDYYLTDPATVPSGNETIFSEKIWHIPTPCIVYRPDKEMGNIQNLPATTNGYVTFGTLTRAARINHRTIRTWANILNKVKNSHLIIDSGDFIDPGIQEELAQKFVSFGIERKRIEIGYHSPPWDVINSIDIGFDCFPHNSGTTLFETLYLGVPFITLADRASVGRLGSSILEGIEHREWIAESETEYEEIAVHLSTNIEKLITIRSQLREELKASPLMDEAGFAEKVETAFIEMFDIWRTKNNSQSQSTSSGERSHISNDTVLHQAESFYQTGEFDQAKTLFLDLLQKDTTNSAINYRLGNIELVQGHLDRALVYFQLTVETNPEEASYWLSYIDALNKSGQTESAAHFLDLAVNAGLEGQEVSALKGCIDASIHKSAGLTYHDKGNYSSAVSEFSKCLELNPNSSETRYFLGNSLVELGLLTEAEQSYRTALKISPEYKEALNNLANTLLQQNKIEEAENCYSKALCIDPDYIEAHFNIGNLLREQNRLPEAKVEYERVITLNPDHFKAYSNLGITCQLLGELKKAAQYYSSAITINPGFMEAHINLGACYKEMGRYVESEQCYKKALVIQPNFPLCLSNLGSVLKEQGKIIEAEKKLQQALKIEPNNAGTHSNLLFLLNYHPDKSGAEIFKEYKKFDANFGIPHKGKWQQHSNISPDNRRLKIGYVSPQFKYHSIRHFLEPLLACHDKQSVEIFAYAEVHTEDHLSEKYRSYVDHWIRTIGMSDAELSEKIISDKIDILVDLAGHTAHNRLGVFVRKPAPVSLHWLDFGYTTGLTAINYYLTDESSVPHGSEKLFSEKPWRLTTPAFVYRPAQEMGSVSPLPAATKGYITFGLLTRAVRINYKTIRTWAKIMHQIEDSRLIIDSNNFKDRAMQTNLKDSFARHGIAPNRLQIGYHSPPWDILRSIDIGFDCFPHNSGTTLFETLYMGIPFITLAGRASVGRLGSSILEGLGRTEWIAYNEDEYVERAIELASNLKNLAHIRLHLRQQMQNSILMNEPAFAKKMEEAYQKMFTVWFNENIRNNSQQTNKVQRKKYSKKKTTLKKKRNRKTQSRPRREDLDTLVSLYQQNDMNKAESLALTLLDKHPTHGQILKILGAIYTKTNLLDMALSTMKKAAKYLPKDYTCLRNIAVILCDQKDYRNAEKYCQRALTKAPNYADGYNTLGIIQRSLQKFDAAEKSCKKALKISSDDPETYINLGLVLHEKGLFQEANENYKKALEHNPNLAEAYCGLSISNLAANKINDAESACRKALLLQHEYPAAYNSLGTILHQKGQFLDAQTAYKKAIDLKPGYNEALHNLGKTYHCLNHFAEAESCYKQALQCETTNAELFFNLGNTLADQKKLQEAENSFIKAIEINSRYAEAKINLGTIYRNQGWLKKAETCYKEALSIRHDYKQVYNNLGNIFQEQGRLEKAEKAFRTVLESHPDFTDAFGNLLFLLNYHPDKSGQEIFEEYREFDHQFGLPLKKFWKPHTNSIETKRRLKIGYVSPQFCQHPVANFLEPLLACHNKDLVEITGYAEIKKEDETTARYRSYMDHWVLTTGMTDDEMASRIRTDNIDILVDLAGHTSHNRLGVFARKPAPISLHWLDFGYTTGLSAIDYYLADETSVPVGSEDLFSENPYRIATPSFVYRPTKGMGEVSTSPAIKHGKITFGCLSRAVRINYRTIRVWAEILRKIEGSRLIINSGSFKDPEMQRDLMEKFRDLSVETARLDIGYNSPPWDVLRRIDIGFDCFPHNSGTTLFETLYMGIPFVTLADRPSVGRLGSSILEGLGRPEWIARTEKEYVEIAITLANDPTKLAFMRSTMRNKMENSALMNEPAFADKVEKAYKNMFLKWCEEQL